MAEPQIKFVLDLEDNVTESVQSLKSRFAETSTEVRRTTEEVLEFSKAIAGTTALVAGIGTLTAAFIKLQEVASTPLGQAGFEILTTTAKSALKEIQPLSNLFSELAKTSGNFIDGFTNGISPKASTRFRQNSEALISGTVEILANRLQRANLGGKIVDGLTIGIEKGITGSLPIIDKSINQLNSQVTQRLLKPLNRTAEIVKRNIGGRATPILEDAEQLATPAQQTTKLGSGLTQQVTQAFRDFRQEAQPRLKSLVNNLVNTIAIEEVAVTLNETLVNAFRGAGQKRVNAIADFLDNFQAETNDKIKSFTKSVLFNITDFSAFDTSTPNLVNAILGDDLKLTRTKATLQAVLGAEGSVLQQILQQPINKIVGSLGIFFSQSAVDAILPDNNNIAAELGENRIIESVVNKFSGNSFAAIGAKISPFITKQIAKGVGQGIGVLTEKLIRDTLQANIDAVLGDFSDLVNSNASAFITTLDKVFGDKVSGFLSAGTKRLNTFLDEFLSRTALAGFELADSLSQITNFSEFGQIGEGIKGFFNTFRQNILEIDNELGGILTSFGSEFVKSNLQAVGSATIDFIRDISANAINEIEQQITSLILTTSEIPSRIQSIIDPISDSALYLTGATEPIELIQDLSNASVQFAQNIFLVTQQLSFLRAGLDALRSFIANSPFQGLIDQNARLRETILATRASLAATASVKLDGVRSQDAISSVKILTEPVNQAIKELREGSLDLVGVTSDELIPVFQIVAQNATEIGASLQDAKDLTLDFSASLGTLGIPLFQARQEINSILQGQITINSALAKTLNLTNAQINSYKTQGVLVERLRERLAAFREGNALAARELAGVTSNIAELFQEINRIAGEPIFDLILDKVNQFYEFLKANRDVITQTFSTVLQTAFAGILEFVDGLGAIKDAFFNIFGGLPEFLAKSFRSILQAIAEGLKFAGALLTPVARLFAELTPLANVVGGSLFQLGVTLKVLSGAISLVSNAFSVLAKLTPVIGEALFFIDVRTNGLIGQFLNLSQAVGRGTAGFLLLAQNLQRLPFLQGQVADGISRIFGGIPLLGNAITAVLPAIGSFGITLVGLVKAFPPLGEVFQNLVKIMPGGIKALGTLVSLTPVISPLGNAIQEVGNKLEFFAQKGDLAQFVTRQFDEQVKAAGLAFQQFAAQTLLLGGGLFVLAVFFDELVLKNETLKELIGAIIEKIREFAQFIAEAIQSPFFIGLLVTLLEITGILPRILQLANAVATQIGQIGSNIAVNAIQRLADVVTGLGDAFVGLTKVILPAKKGIEDAIGNPTAEIAQQIKQLQDERAKIQAERTKIKDELRQLAEKDAQGGLTVEEQERGIQLGKDLDARNRELNRIDKQLEERSPIGTEKRKREAEAQVIESQFKLEGADRQIESAKKQLEAAEQALQQAQQATIDLVAETDALNQNTQQQIAKIDQDIQPLASARDAAQQRATDTTITPVQRLEAKIEAENIQKQIDVLDTQAQLLQEKQFAILAIGQKNAQLLDGALGLDSNTQKSIEQAIAETKDELLKQKQQAVSSNIQKLETESSKITQSITSSLEAQVDTLANFGSALKDSEQFKKASLRDKLELIEVETINAIRDRQDKIVELTELRDIALKTGDTAAANNATKGIVAARGEIASLNLLRANNSDLKIGILDAPKKQELIKQQIAQLQEQLKAIALTPDDLNKAIADIDQAIKTTTDPQTAKELRQKKRELLLTQVDVEAQDTFNQRKSADVSAAQVVVQQAKRRVATAEADKVLEQQAFSQNQARAEKLQQQLQLQRLQLARSEVAFAQEEIAITVSEIERLNRKISSGKAAKEDFAKLNELNKKRDALIAQEAEAQDKAIAIEQEITGGIQEQATKSKAVQDLEEQKQAAQRRIDDLQSRLTDATPPEEVQQIADAIAVEQENINRFTKDIEKLTFDERIALADRQKAEAATLKQQNAEVRKQLRIKQNRIANIKNTPSLKADAGAQQELLALDQEVDALKKTLNDNEKKILTLETSSDRNRIATLQAKRNALQQRIIQLQKQLALLGESPDTGSKAEAISETEAQIAELQKEKRRLERQVTGEDTPFSERVGEEFNKAEAERIANLQAQQDAIEKTFDLDLDTVDLVSPNQKQRQRAAKRRAKRARARRRLNRNKIFGRVRDIAGDIADQARGLLGIDQDTATLPLPTTEELRQQAKADAQQVARRRQKQLADRAARGRNILRDFIEDRQSDFDRLQQRARAKRAERLASETAQLEADEADLANIADPAERQRRSKAIAERRRKNEARRRRGITPSSIESIGEIGQDALSNATKTIQKSLQTIGSGFESFVSNPLQSLKTGIGNLGSVFTSTFKNSLQSFAQFKVTFTQGLFLAGRTISAVATGIKTAVFSTFKSIAAGAGSIISAFAPMIAITATIGALTELYGKITKANDLYNKSIKETNAILKEQSENLILNSRLQKQFLSDRVLIIQAELDALEDRGQGDSERANALRARLKRLEQAITATRSGFDDEQRKAREDEVRGQNSILKFVAGGIALIPETIAALPLGILGAFFNSNSTGLIGNTFRTIEESNIADRTVEVSKRIQGINETLLLADQQKVVLQESVRKTAELRNRLNNTTSAQEKNDIENQIKQEEDTQKGIVEAFKFDEQLKEAFALVIDKDQEKTLTELQLLVNKKKQELQNISSAVLTDIDLIVAGSEIAQLQTQARQSITDIDKSFLEGIGNTELLNQRVDFFTKTVVELVELRQLSEEEAIQTLERIAANPFLASDKAASGLEALNNLSKRLLERQTEDLKFTRQQAEKLVAEGRADAIDLLPTFTQQELEVTELPIVEFTKRKNNVLKNLDTSLQKEIEFRRKRLANDLRQIDLKLSDANTPNAERSQLLEKRKTLEDDFNKTITEATEATNKRRLELERTFALEEAQLLEERLQQRAAIFQKEIEQVQQELEQKNRLERIGIEENNQLRLLSLQKQLADGVIIAEELAKAEAEINVEKTRNEAEQARKRLEALQEIQARATDLSVQEQEKIQQQVAEARIATVQAVADAIKAEQQLTDAFLAQSTAKLKNFEKETSLTIEEQNSLLSEQKEIADALNQSLERRKKLLDEAKSVFASQQQLTETELSIIQSSSDLNEFDKQEIAQQTANIKIEAALLEIELQKESLRIEQEQQRIALARRDIENEIAQAKAEVEVLTKQNALTLAQSRLQLSPDSLEAQLAVKEAELGLRSALLQRASLQQEKQFIDEDRNRLEEQFAIQNKNQETQERIARLNAAQQIVSAAEQAKDPEAGLLRERLLQDIASKGGLSIQQLFSGNRSKASLERIISGTPASDPSTAIDRRLVTASQQLRSAIRAGSPDDTTKSSQPIVTVEKLADGSVKETVELLDAITETVRDAKGNIISINSIGKSSKPKSPTDAERIIGDRLTQERETPTIASPSKINREIIDGVKQLQSSKAELSEITNKPLPDKNPPAQTIAEVQNKLAEDQKNFNANVEKQIKSMQEQTEKLAEIGSTLLVIAEKLNLIPTVKESTKETSADKSFISQSFFDSPPATGAKASLANEEFISKASSALNAQLSSIATFAPSGISKLLTQVQAVVGNTGSISRDAVNQKLSSQLEQGQSISARNAPISTPTPETGRNNTYNINNKFNITVGSRSEQQDGLSIAEQVSKQVNQTFAQTLAFVSAKQRR